MNTTEPIPGEVTSVLRLTSASAFVGFIFGCALGAQDLQTSLPSLKHDHTNAVLERAKRLKELEAGRALPGVSVEKDVKDFFKPDLTMQREQARKATHAFVRKSL